MHQEQILISLAGDTMIGRLVNEYLDNAPPEHIWGNMLPLLKQCDYNIINLEAAITRSEKIVPKVFNFKADPEKVQSLLAGSINLVNLANNHVLDYAEEGLLETLEVLDRHGIKRVGAGKNIQEARCAAVVDVKGLTVGVLGCTDNEPGWKAGPKKPGTNYVEVGDLTTLKEDIAAVRDRVDLLILSIHWGPNMVERPSKEFRAFAHALIDAGVDVIHGHSAHIFQGVEVYKERLILYDTGDFVDDYWVDPLLRNDRGFLFLLEIANGSLSVRLVPTLIRHFQAIHAPKDEAESTIARMRMLSKEFRTVFEGTEELVLKGKTSYGAR